MEKMDFNLFVAALDNTEPKIFRKKTLLKLLLPKIDAMVKSGEFKRDILARLNDAGLDMKYNTFIKMVNALQREAAANASHPGRITKKPAEPTPRHPVAAPGAGKVEYGRGFGHDPEDRL